MIAVPSKGSHPRDRDAAPANTALLNLLICQNLFNTFSPYLTLAINASVVAILLTRHQLRCVIPAPVVISSVYAVLIWMLVVVAFRGEADTQIVFKYFRTTLAVSTLALIFGSRCFPASSIIKAINLAFGLHVLLVMLQIAFPDLTAITAPIFGFEREITIVEQYTMRKLGATSSYDTASLLSVVALLFFYQQFTQGKGRRYLLMAAVAFVATFMSSRTGMAMSLLLVSVLFVLALLRAKLAWKLVASTGIAALAVAAYFLIYPLLLQTLGLSELQSDDVSFAFAATDYGTTGTLEALTEDHLKPLDQPLSDLLIGFAVDPNAIGRETDIGYVKFIYHVGIVGTLVVLFVHFYMLVATSRFVHASMRDRDRDRDHDRTSIARLLFALIAISLVFNYKSLEIHSRGTGDFIYMLFLFLASTRAIVGGSGSPSNTKAL